MAYNIEVINTPECIKWEDDDVEQLLRCVKEFKAAKEYEGIDWETIKDKYECIRMLFVRDKREGEDTAKYTRDRIATKIKAIRSNYRKVVDSGCKNGGGRTVATFHDMCKDIWKEGTTSTDPIPRTVVDPSLYYESAPQIDIVNFKREHNSYNDENNDETLTAVITTHEQEYDTNSVNETHPVNGTNTINDTHTFNDNQVRAESTLRFIHEKRKKVEKRLPSVPIEQQLLDIVKEDFAFKKQLLSHMTRQDEQINAAIKGMQQSVATFTQTMSSFIETFKSGNNQQPTPQATHGLPSTSSSDTPHQCCCRCRRIRSCCCCG